nr:probable RNA-binding protein ARP1 [Ipomoea trifida]
MMMSNNVNHNNNGVHHHQSFGDTTLTKVFVGGLAWETPLEAMREHFEKYGEILEAVIISDKLTGRSKGYGFVTFKDAESARKACADPSPLINGRRANCNLASLGARRPKPPPNTTTSPPPQGHNTGARATSTPPTNYVQWYYPTGAPPQAAAASPFHHRRHLNHQAVPFYRYSPAYIPSNVNYNHVSRGTYIHFHIPKTLNQSNLYMPFDSETIIDTSITIVILFNTISYTCVFILSTTRKRY